MGADMESGRKRGFEPPPWEKHLFEDLARRKAAAVGDSAGADRDSEVAPAAEQIGTPPPDEGDEANDAGTPPIDARVMDAMLVQLSGEEGSALKPVARASRGFAAGLAVMGAAMVLVGGVTAARMAGTGAVGALGAGTIVVFGAFITGAAVWLWVRAGRVQGS